MRSRWLPVVLYVGLIFTLSSIRRPPPGPDVQHVDKLFHLAEYAMLGLLLWRAGRPARGTARGALVTAVVIGLGVGMIDELYQRSVPGREASLLDVAADLCGVALGAVAAAWWDHRRQATKRRAVP